MPQRVRLPPRRTLTARADRERPPVPPREGREQAMLAASRAVIGLFLRERTSDFSVKQLAAHAGLSERTFYRYFPRKEDAIRPVVYAALERTVSDLRAASHGKPLREALVEAFGRILAEDPSLSWENLLPVLNETESLRAACLQVLTDAEVAFAHVVAERLGLAPDSPRARMAGAVLATAGRLAVDQPVSSRGRRDPVELLAEYLEVLGPALFEEPAGGHRPSGRPGPRGSRAGPRRPTP